MNNYIVKIPTSDFLNWLKLNADKFQKLDMDHYSFVIRLSGTSVEVDCTKHV